MIYYYLTVYPTEALIASQLEPAHFGTYMSTGARHGSAERLVFIHLNEGGFGDAFDWAYAEESCARAEQEGQRRRSAYLSIYRALEQVPLDKFGDLYLVTRDGRSLALPPQPAQEDAQGQKTFLYQELCPAHPLVVSSQCPAAFARNICSAGNPVNVPKIVLADLVMGDLHAEDSGNIHYHNLGHLEDCIAALAKKTAKIVDRSTMANFAFDHIASGIYVGDSENCIKYPMKTRDELSRHHYEWARSADIL